MHIIRFLVPFEFDALYAPIIGDDIGPEDMNCLKRLDDGNRIAEFIFDMNNRSRHREGAETKGAARRTMGFESQLSVNLQNELDC